MIGISEESAAFYRTNGFLFPIEAYSEDQASGLRAQLEAVEASQVTDARTRRAFRNALNLVAPFADAIVRDPKIVDPVSAILGPDVLCWGCGLFVKEPRTADYVSWHQDLHYWGLDDSEGEVTAWLALSPATRESGCMKFMPGSHRAAVAHKEGDAAGNMLSRGQEVAVDVDEEAAVHVVLRPGEFSLHHGLLFHGSNPNRSDDRRIGMAIRYVSARTKNVGPSRTNAVLVRGENRYGNFDPMDGPAGLFLPDEVAAAERALVRRDAYTLAGRTGG
jgi:non-haem Fe2+, alpha-ketoglutarate-dependent halogenase